MSTLIFVKLGGSLLTDKNQAASPRDEKIRQCAREIADALRARPDLQILLAHGSGSFGHVAAVQSRFGSGAVTGYAETGAAAARLNRIVADLCLAEGLQVVSLQPSASAVCDEGRLVALATRPLELALANGLTPLLFGDVAFDLKRGCVIVSTELLFDYLARRLQPARIILAGQVNGVFSADPLRDPSAQRIPLITPASFPAVRDRLGGSHGVDVTGGMLSKVELMVTLAQALPEVRIQIISGETGGVLRRCLLRDDDEEGTVIAGNRTAAE